MVVVKGWSGRVGGGQGDGGQEMTWWGSRGGGDKD